MELAVVLRDYGEELEGELGLRGIDLRDAEDPESSFTLRRLHILYSSLPPGNRISHSVSKMAKDARAWDSNTYVLANVFDAIQSLNYTIRCQNVAKGQSPPKKPQMHPRPKGQQRRPERPKNWFPGKTIYSSS